MIELHMCGILYHSRFIKSKAAEFTAGFERDVRKFAASGNTQ